MVPIFQRRIDFGRRPNLLRHAPPTFWRELVPGEKPPTRNLRPPESSIDFDLLFRNRSRPIWAPVEPGVEMPIAFLNMLLEEIV